MTIYLSEKEARGLKLDGATPRKKAKDARPNLPRAGRAAVTGLTTFLLAGWHWTYDVRYGYRLTNPDGRDTGWCVGEREACDKAKGLVK